jgi:hypothetical protein
MHERPSIPGNNQSAGRTSAPPSCRVWDSTCRFGFRVQGLQLEIQVYGFEFTT